MGSTTNNGTWPFNGGTLRLGTTNVFNIGPGTGTAIQLSGYRSSGNHITFLGDPASSTLKIRATNGTSRAGAIVVSTASSGTGAGTPITASFALGVADALVGDILVADTVQAGTDAAVTGGMTMAGGTLDANTLVLGRVNCISWPVDPVRINTLNGSFTQGGGTATIGTLTLGNVIGPGVPVAVVNLPIFQSTYTVGAGATLEAATINANPDGLPVFRNTSVRTLALNDGTLRNKAGGDLAVSGADATAAGRVNIVLGGSTTNTVEATAGQSITVAATAPISGAGGLTKTGEGTLQLAGDNTYTGTTNVTAGTLALVGGSQASDITVAGGAFLGFTPGSPTTSTASVTFDAGAKVKIIGTPTLGSYTLMTAASFTGTPVLETAIPNYELVVDGNALKLNSTAAGFSTWIAGTFANGNTVPPAQQGPDADPDSDGIANLLEYAVAGLDPTVPNASLGTLSGLTITYAKRQPLAADITYAIQTSDDLGAVDTWQAAAATQNDTQISYTLQNPGDNFARLKVVQP
jgi:autotransporter-associated beta strand protein